MSYFSIEFIEIKNVMDENVQKKQEHHGDDNEAFEQERVVVTPEPDQQSGPEGANATYKLIHLGRAQIN
jgi:hypothetical protein